MSGVDRMEAIVSWCKRRGFVYPDSEIYGGFANAWDYGPYGVELKRNIEAAWWNRFVRQRGDMIGVDTPIIQHPKVWHASGHLATFSDPLVDCKKCKHRFRADHLLEAKAAEPGYDKEKPIEMKDVRCPLCGGELTDIRQFNLMFQTHIGPTQDEASIAYLRPETAAGMFTTFKNIRDTMRRKLPFGIAQIGRAFRNEITPGNFTFRTREFEQMEIEYFVKPDDAPRAFEMWLEELKKWNTDVLRLAPEHVFYHEIPDSDRAFYSRRTVDVEYLFPFGQKELYGLANRTDHDLSRQMELSGEDLRWFDPETNERFVPHVVEPSWGLSRTVLAVLCEHYDVDQAPTTDGEESAERIVARFPHWLAPVKIAVLPLSKKEVLSSVAQELAATLRKHGVVEYDETQSIGKRYRRQDEIGTPFCVTVDFESLDDKAVTVRERDSMQQERVSISELDSYFAIKLHAEA